MFFDLEGYIVNNLTGSTALTRVNRTFSMTAWDWSRKSILIDQKKQKKLNFSAEKYWNSIFYSRSSWRFRIFNQWWNVQKT